MTGRLIAALRSRWVRFGFLAVALTLAVFALLHERQAVLGAISQLPWSTLGASGGAALIYVGLTMLAWRAVLADLGSHLTVGDASKVFFLSQLGKYVPGGVWNVVAAAELGAGHRIPRRRSLSAMAVTILVSIVTGMAVAVVAISLGPPVVSDRYGWVVWTLPVFLASLAPPVLNRILGFLLRISKRPPLEHPLTANGAGAAIGWSVLSWLAAGLHIWLLATAEGLPATPRSFALATGGYALAWVVGFMVVFVPAGLGAREAVLVATLVGEVESGGVLAVVLISRLTLTLVDVGLGLVGLALMRVGRRARV
ncbi:MAG: lysylphosphatidylglycerol synthase domain-containing protein [Dermatophilaceae bacterium]